MIDKINGNGVYNLQGNSSRKKNQAEQAYEDTPGVKEFNKNIKKEASSKAARKSRTEDQKSGPGQNGVILDLSSNAGKKHIAASEHTGSLTGTLRKLLAPVLAPVVRWLKNFWESDNGAAPQDTSLKDEAAPRDIEALDAGLLPPETLPPLEAGMDPVSVPQAGAVQNEVLPGYEKIPADVLKSGNLKQMEQFLTQNGERHLAHNSDLLTYYDRRGKLVSIDESEKNRVLYGDKNVHRL